MISIKPENTGSTAETPAVLTITKFMARQLLAIMTVVFDVVILTLSKFREFWYKFGHNNW